MEVAMMILLGQEPQHTNFYIISVKFPIF